jgi:hypothetical protein
MKSYINNHSCFRSWRDFLFLDAALRKECMGEIQMLCTCAEAPMYVELNHLNRAIFYEAERVDLETKFEL